MKEIKFTVYEFDELSDKAKDYAIKNFPHEVDWIDTDCILDYAVEKAQETGFFDVEISCKSNRGYEYDTVSCRFYLKDCEKLFGFKPDLDYEPDDEDWEEVEITNGWLKGDLYYSWLPDDNAENLIWETLREFSDLANTTLRKEEEWLYTEERVIEEYQERESLFYPDGKLYQL